MSLKRETVRKIKKFDSKQLHAWLQAYGYNMYCDGKRDAILSLLLKLVDEFNFTNDDISKLLSLSGVWLEGAQAGSEINSEEIKAELLKEGIACLHNI